MEEAEGRCCAVLGCTNSGGGLSEWRAAECERHRPLLRADCPCLEPFCFYGFPSGAEERGHWLQALRGRGLELEAGAGAGAAVCSLHLEEGTLLLGLGLCKKPAAGQVAPPPASPTTTTVETRSSRARKRRHPGPRPWLHQEPAGRCRRRHPRPSSLLGAGGRPGHHAAPLRLQPAGRPGPHRLPEGGERPPEAAEPTTGGRARHHGPAAGAAATRVSVSGATESRGPGAA
ncbi:translation initiation factor IF-2-like [Leucoraja erinacea]|uniref:translation initiation factor IF-2-like n=1 Tax=Leucoraja erinaceus TaxID=7782 RepID=UPI0024572B0E|nr:translation initiation factor IF-2-like [Leucoraja erinacea]XP_055518530.1 translation initiation factor IF-2-like [Leucoraja erinacea]